MSRRIIGYIDGVAQWQDLGPAENVGWGRAIGGQAIEPRSKPSPDIPRPRKVIPVTEYQARAAKGWATRQERRAGR